jgi:hypothetical protein
MLILLRKFGVKLLSIFCKTDHFIAKEKNIILQNSVAYKKVSEFISNFFIGLAPAGTGSLRIGLGQNRTI